MLKRDYDRLKKAAKKQQALQQSMLNVAQTDYKPTAELVPAAPSYPFYKCPFVMGTAFVLLLVFFI